MTPDTSCDGIQDVYMLGSENIDVSTVDTSLPLSMSIVASDLLKQVCPLAVLLAGFTSQLIPEDYHICVFIYNNSVS